MSYQPQNAGAWDSLGLKAAREAEARHDLLQTHLSEFGGGRR